MGLLMMMNDDEDYDEEGIAMTMISLKIDKLFFSPSEKEGWWIWQWKGKIGK